MRNSLTLALVVALAGCGGGGGDLTTAPPTSVTALATDQLVFDSTRHDATNPNANREIYVMKTDGSASSIKRLTNDAAYQNWWPRISPDRKKILFYRRPASELTDNYAEASLWVMNADGSGVTQLLAKGAYGWIAQGHAEWSPDGTKLAMFGSVGTGVNVSFQVFVTSATGTAPVQYTNQPSINTDVSWSPDGTKLLFNGCPSLPCGQANPEKYEIFVMNANAPLSAPTRLTTDGVADYDPYFSPNGQSIAWLTTTDPAANGGYGAWNIRIADVSGTSPMTLSNIITVPNDSQITSKPAWSADGNTLYFHRLDFTQEPVFGVFSIGKTGTGLTRLTNTGTGVNEFPSTR
jgi:Tol biopolymer transport system component